MSILLEISSYELPLVWCVQVDLPGGGHANHALVYPRHRIDAASDSYSVTCQNPDVVDYGDTFYNVSLWDRDDAYLGRAQFLCPQHVTEFLAAMGVDVFRREGSVNNPPGNCGHPLVSAARSSWLRRTLIDLVEIFRASGFTGLMYVDFWHKIHSIPVFAELSPAELADDLYDESADGALNENMCSSSLWCERYAPGWRNLELPGMYTMLGDPLHVLLDCMRRAAAATRSNETPLAPYHDTRLVGCVGNLQAAEVVP